MTTYAAIERSLIAEGVAGFLGLVGDGNNASGAIIVFDGFGAAITAGSGRIEIGAGEIPSPSAQCS
jgi:hypothetical protein